MNLSLVNDLEILAGSALVIGAGTFLYGTQIEPKAYRLESIDVTLPDVKLKTTGSKCIKILHISDLHLCYPESHKIEFLRKITDDDYDFVFLTGDVFENFSGLAYAKSILSRVPRLGAYAVLGNHDYFNYTMLNKTLGKIVRKFKYPKQKRNVDAIVDALQKSNFTVLRNESVELKDAGMQIIGIDYPSINADDLKKLVNNCSQDALQIALFHVPLNLGTICNTKIKLAFGGHTHGGQIRIPGIGAIITDSELSRSQASGLVQRGNTLFHISRGLGADPRSNIRLFCPPAATVINITCG